MHWKDVSSFSRGDKDRTPKAWSFEAGKLKISVHRHIHYPPETWLATCEPFFSNKELTEENEASAKAEALNSIQTLLENAINDIKDAV